MKLFLMLIEAKQKFDTPQPCQKQALKDKLDPLLQLLNRSHLVPSTSVHSLAILSVNHHYNQPSSQLFLHVLFSISAAWTAACINTSCCTKKTHSSVTQQSHSV